MTTQIVRRLSLSLLLGAALAAPLAAQKLPGPGEPALSELTARSGGPLDPVQRGMRFDRGALQIELFPQTRRIAGIAELVFTATVPLDRLVVDLDRNLPVSAIAIDGRALPRGSWSNPEGRLSIRLPSPVAQGQAVTARISYAGTPHVAVRAPWDGGFVWAKTPGGQPWIATAVQGSGCDLFWPCIDHPTAEPKRLDIAITVPRGLKAVSNGRLLGTDTLADGRSTWRWSVTNPTNYAVALNVGPYEIIRATYRSRFGNSFPMEYWYLPGDEAKARGLFAEFAPTIDFFEATVGPYPFADEKMGVVHTPHLGMEHQTVNAYGNGYRKDATGFDWLFHHEFAHEWFANQLTAADWDDFWLHEGFGQYMQPLYGRWREGEARYAAMMLEGRPNIANAHPIVSGRPRAAEDVYQEARGGPGQDIYYKGAWVLHTLRGLIGDEAFRRATTRLVYGRADPEPGNFTARFGTTAEFRRIVAEEAKRDLGWFFDVYLNQAALPDLVERRDGDTLTLEWRVPGGGAFPLPVEVQVDGRVQAVAMAGGRGSLRVPAGAHVVVDPMARVLRRSEAVEAMRRQPRAAEAM